MRDPDLSRPNDFWSRRRAAVEAEKATEETAKETARDAQAEAAWADQTDEEILGELDLPDPDTLKPGDDFSAFMSKAVPDRLRKRALRQLWLSNPTLANVDGLLEYGEDYTDSATVLGTVRSLYQVGKGMPGSETAQEPQEPEETAAQADPDLSDEDADDTEDMATKIAAQTPEDAVLLAMDDAAEDEHLARPRRMHFRFES